MSHFPAADWQLLGGILEGAAQPWGVTPDPAGWPCLPSLGVNMTFDYPDVDFLFPSILDFQFFRLQNGLESSHLFPLER